MALANLAMVPLTIHYIGKEKFGLWMVVSSLVIWMQLADLGVGNGLTNALAEAHGRDDQKAASGYISAALVASSAVAIISIVPVVLLSLWLPWNIILNLTNAELALLAAKCFLVTGIIFVLNIPLSLAGRALIAYQRGYLASATQLLSAVASLIGLLIAIILKLGMVWLVLLLSAGPMVGNLLAWGILLKILPWLSIDWRAVTRQAIHRVASSSIPLFLFQIGALLVNQLVNVIIAQVGTLKMVADYNIIFKIYILVFTIGISLSAPFYPAIREAYEKNEAHWVFRALHRVLLVRLGILLPAGICLLFFGDRIIQLWIGLPLESRFGLMGWFTFLLSLIFAAASSTLGEILMSLDDIWSQIKIVFITAVIVLSTMYYFIPLIGVPSIFLAMAVSTVYPIIWSWNRLHLKLQQKFS